MSTTARSTATSSASAASSAPRIPSSMRSRPFMASDTNSTTVTTRPTWPLSWSGRWTLAHRILAVNVLTIVLLALERRSISTSIRNRLSKERTPPDPDRGDDHRSGAWPRAAAASGRELLRDDFPVEREPDARLRPDGTLVARQLARSPVRPTSCATRHAEMDQGRRARARPRVQLRSSAPSRSTISSSRRSTSCRHGPKRSRQGGRDEPYRGPQRARPDSRHFGRRAGRRPTSCWSPTTTAPSPAPCAASARRSAAIMIAVILLSVLLSLFLARTIVRPLRRLALAAHRVRLGRAREVNVPRLPSRTDEIGLLARSVADMSQSLRQRIDNIEAFAADVTPRAQEPARLAALGDGRPRPDRGPRAQAQADRSRPRRRRPARPADQRHQRGRPDRRRARPREVRIGRPRPAHRAAGRRAGKTGARKATRGSPSPARARRRRWCMGKPDRLARAINAIIDNAVSFSPPGGLVEIAAARVGDEVRIRIDDEGPGVPPEAREAIFNRFHSVRPRERLRPPFGARPRHRPGDRQRP